MDAIVLKSTSITPLIIFDPKIERLEIKGVSIPENSINFYQPLLECLDSYALGPVSSVAAHIQLDYFNTASSKSILDVLRRLKVLHDKGFNVTINWYYEKEDEDMREVGENYQLIVGLTFNMKTASSATTK